MFDKFFIDQFYLTLKLVVKKILSNRGKTKKFACSYVPGPKKKLVSFFLSYIIKSYTNVFN